MDNYIQKINSRSGTVMGGSDTGGQLLQPEGRPAFSNEGTDVFEPGEQIGTETGTLNPTTETRWQSPISPNQPADSGKEKTFGDLLARPDSSTTDKVNDATFKPPVDLQPSRERQMELPKSTTEPISLIIERINDRIHSNTMLVQSNDVAHMDEDRTSFAGKNIIRPAIIEVQERRSDPGNEVKTDQPSKKNSLSPTIAKIAEKLVPVKDQRLPDIPTRKTPAASKLVIGRITIEVVNPVTTPVKTNEPYRRVDKTQNAPAKEFKGIDKLHFGLGQL